MEYILNSSPQTSLKSVEVPVSFYGNFEKRQKSHYISELKQGFLDHAQFEKGFSTETIIKYNDCLRCFVRTIGDLPISELEITHFIELRKKLMHRNVGDARIASIIFAMKSFLRYCRETLELSCLDPKKVKSPRKPKREVVYMTNEEVDKFIKAINIYNKWEDGKNQKRINIRNLRFRTLVEVLLGTGVRISEALSLNISEIDFKAGEATIIGKGNKQRTIYFSPRAIWWIKKYLATRQDDNDALFVTHPKAARLKRPDIWRLFSRFTKKAGINKKISAHTLRHTFATNMLYNGCDLVTIKELLGHAGIEVTARAYIGIDKRKIKENHMKYLNYED